MSKPRAYFSEKLKSVQLNYITYDIEFYALVQSLKHWSSYLAYSDFILYSDHEALKHLNSQDKLSARHAKWAAFVQLFSFTIKDKSGALNKVANTLSRKTSNSLLWRTWPLECRKALHCIMGSYSKALNCAFLNGVCG
jgi:hypothetical protein